MTGAATPAAVLLECLKRPEIRCGDFARRLEAVNVDELATLAREHRVASLVSDALRQNGAAPAAHAFKDDDVRTAAMHLRCFEDLVRAGSALDAARLRWLVVKGPVLSESVYRRRGLRTFVDLDLVVAPANLGAAIDALVSAGASLLDRNWPLSERLMLGQLNIVLPAGTPGDLHWHLLNERTLRRVFTVPMAEVFDRAVPVTLAGLELSTLDTVDTLLHLGLHAAMSGGTRLVLLKDIDELVCGRDVDWDDVARRARRWRAGVPVATMLERCRVALGTPVPRDRVRELAGGRLWPALVRLGQAAFPPAQATGRSPSRMLARSARDTTARSVIELGRRSVHAALGGKSPEAAERERKDPFNPGSVLYADGGEVGLRSYLAAVAGHDGDRGPSSTGTSAMIVVLNLPVPDDRRVWAEAQALRAGSDRVVVVCPAIRGYRPGWSPLDGIDIRYFSTFEGGGPATTIAEGVWTTLAATLICGLLLRREAFRVVQVCNPPDSLAPLLRLAAARGARTVYDQHDAVPVLAAEKIPVPGAARLFQVMERSTVAAADVVLSPSGEQGRRIHALYDRDVVVVRTAPTEAASPARPPVEGRLTLGYLGVVGSQDGVDDVARAVAEVRARTKVDFEVRIAGDGPSLPAVRALVQALGLDGVISFEGWLDAARVGSFLAGLDGMLVPDPPTPFNHMCAMNKVTHAMAAGIPIIYRPLRENVSVAGGLGYLAQGESVADFAGAIVEFLSAGPGARAAVGGSLHERFGEAHSWPVHRARYLAAVIRA